jgi:hypothetical protein
MNWRKEREKKKVPSITLHVFETSEVEIILQYLSSFTRDYGDSTTVWKKQNKKKNFRLLVVKHTTEWDTTKSSVFSKNVIQNHVSESNYSSIKIYYFTKLPRLRNNNQKTNRNTNDNRQIEQKLIIRYYSPR